jgi:excisionase family DNA binding protein
MSEITILTAKEVAEMLQIHLSTVYKHVYDGCIPCIRVGRTLRFSKEAVMLWLKSSVNET